MAVNIKLKGKSLTIDGKTVKPNDHVYVSAPWEDREGEPYIVARMVEFLPPSSASTSTSASAYPRVRVAYYLRPRDITSRYLADFRLVVATMHMDVIPASYVRGFCTVRHKEHVTDMDAYKRTPDAFYWTQLYDRYLHRYLDAVPVNKIRNAPAEVVHHLVNHFEFILCEPGIATELCDAQRGCTTCHKWAANPESVTCARCARVYHLGCVEPPLAMKPKAGYAWSCAPCSKAHEEQVESFMQQGVAPSKDPSDKAVIVPVVEATAERGKGKTRVKPAEKAPDPNPDPKKWRMTNGWPFRYFGMHTQAETVLDPHDSLYPRASTRLGSKFQINIPDWDYANNKQFGLPEPPYRPQNMAKGKARPRASTTKTVEPKTEKAKAKFLQTQLIARGEGSSISIIAEPGTVEDSTIDEVVAEIKKLPTYTEVGVELIDRAVARLHEQDSEGSAPDKAAVISALSALKQTELGFPIWSETEKKKLNSGASHHGDDLEEIAERIPTKKMKDVVKRFYMRIGHKHQHDVSTQPQFEEKPVTAKVDVKKKKPASRRKEILPALTDDESDPEEGSICGQPATANSKRTRSCAICETTSSSKWYHCPTSLVESDTKPRPCVMCEECGIRWRHYGIQYPPDTDDPKQAPVIVIDGVAKGPLLTKAPKSKKKVDKSAKVEEKSVEGSIKGGSKTAKAVKVAKAKGVPNAAASDGTSSLSSAESSVEPAPKVPSKPCVLCKRAQPAPQLVKCASCTMSVHRACYGVSETVNASNWRCELCDMRYKKKPLKGQPACLLCPPRLAAAAEAPITALDCLKKTEHDNYVHLLCAIWHPELRIGEPDRLGLIEGLSAMYTRRDRATCFICRKDNGACLKCEDCPQEFHLSCAWSAGYKFSFEVVGFRKKRMKEQKLAKFKNEQGAMHACVWCPAHMHFSPKDRLTYDMGSRDSKTKMTALQAFVEASKAPVGIDTFSTIRQARRLDPIIRPVLGAPLEPVAQTRADVAARTNKSLRPNAQITPFREVRAISANVSAQQPSRTSLGKRSQRSVVSMSAASDSGKSDDGANDDASSSQAKKRKGPPKGSKIGQGKVGTHAKGSKAAAEAAARASRLAEPTAGPSSAEAIAPVEPLELKPVLEADYSRPQRDAQRTMRSSGTPENATPPPRQSRRIRKSLIPPNIDYEASAQEIPEAGTPRSTALPPSPVAPRSAPLSASTQRRAGWASDVIGDVRPIKPSPIKRPSSARPTPSKPTPAKSARVSQDDVSADRPAKRQRHEVPGTTAQAQGSSTSNGNDTAAPGLDVKEDDGEEDDGEQVPMRRPQRQRRAPRPSDAEPPSFAAYAHVPITADMREDSSSDDEVDAEATVDDQPPLDSVGEAFDGAQFLLGLAQGAAAPQSSDPTMAATNHRERPSKPRQSAPLAPAHAATQSTQLEPVRDPHAGPEVSTSPGGAASTPQAESSDRAKDTEDAALATSESTVVPSAPGPSNGLVGTAPIAVSSSEISEEPQHAMASTSHPADATASIDSSNESNAHKAAEATVAGSSDNAAADAFAPLHDDQYGTRSARRTAAQQALLRGAQAFLASSAAKSSAAETPHQGRAANGSDAGTAEAIVQTAYPTTDASQPTSHVATQVPRAVDSSQVVEDLHSSPYGTRRKRISIRVESPPAAAFSAADDAQDDSYAMDAVAPADQIPELATTTSRAGRPVKAMPGRYAALAFPASVAHARAGEVRAREVKANEEGGQPRKNGRFGLDKDDYDFEPVAPSRRKNGPPKRGRGYERKNPRKRPRDSDPTDPSPSPSVEPAKPDAPYCNNCGITESSLFRRDPSGLEGYVCNACGLYFKAHGKQRPSRIVNRGLGSDRVVKRRAIEDRKTGKPVSIFIDDTPDIARKMRDEIYGTPFTGLRPGGPGTTAEAKWLPPLSPSTFDFDFERMGGWEAGATSGEDDDGSTAAGDALGGRSRSGSARSRSASLSQSRRASTDDGTPKAKGKGKETAEVAQPGPTLVADEEWPARAHETMLRHTNGWNGATPSSSTAAQILDGVNGYESTSSFAFDPALAAASPPPLPASPVVPTWTTNTTIHPDIAVMPTASASVDPETADSETRQALALDDVWNGQGDDLLVAPAI